MTLREELRSLAEKFALEIAEKFADASIDVIRSSSVDKFTAAFARSSPSPSSNGIPKRSPAEHKRPSVAPPAEDSKPRLVRRSAQQIDEVLDKVVSLLSESENPMRSEEIRGALGLDKREIPRILREGIHKRLLRTRGRKRATVYFLSAQAAE